jgi:hypothetical protein
LSKKVDVKRTGKYNNYITFSKDRWGDVYLINNSDVGLLVGGTYRGSNQGNYFAVLVPPNGEERLHGHSFPDLKIDFIERY